MTLRSSGDSAISEAPDPSLELKVTTELMRLRKRGKLAPKSVVEAARDPGSPLHNYFEWDDGIAAEKFRLDQARRLIRVVKIEVVTTSHTIGAVGMVHDPNAEPGEQGYVATLDVRKSAEDSRAVMRYELTRLRGLAERVASLGEVLGMEQKKFRPLFRAADALLSEVAED